MRITQLEGAGPLGRSAFGLPRSHWLINAKISAERKFWKKSLGRRDRFRPKIVKIGAILAIFELFEVRKICMPFFGEFARSSQDLRKSDYNYKFLGRSAEFAKKWQVHFS